MSQQIDKRIINKIHQLVGDGMRNIIEMQRPLGVLRWNSLILSKSLLEIVNAFILKNVAFVTICITQLQNCACPK